jgi:nucleoside 2-deoxyribosyltransferase
MGLTMKIYFAGSIRAGREDAPLYKSLIDYLSCFGEVLTEHVGLESLSERGDDGPDDGYIYERDMSWLSACDILVAEVSVPSLGVGYEVGWAVALKKPVLCLYKSGSQNPLSAMIAGNPEIETVFYTSLDHARNVVADFINERL